MVQGEPEVAHPDRHEVRFAVGLGEGPAHRCLEHLVPFGREFDEQEVPIGEVVAGGRVGHPDPTGEASEGDRLGALLLEERTRLGEEGVAQVAMVVVGHGSRSYLTTTR